MSKNYVQLFTLADSVFFNMFDNQVSQNTGLSFVFSGEGLSSDLATRFDSLTTHFGDTAYYGAFPPTFGLYDAVADEFISVDLVADRDFDLSHPAGKSLNDIVRFHGISPYQYITSGYANKFDWSNRNNLPEGFYFSYLSPLVNGYHPVFKRLSELTPEDLKLLGRTFNLTFTVPPPLGTHHFTLTFQTATKELTRTKEIVFKSD